MQIGSKWHRQTKKKLSCTVCFGVEEEGESERRTKSVLPNIIPKGQTRTDKGNPEAIQLQN